MPLRLVIIITYLCGGGRRGREEEEEGMAEGEWGGGGGAGVRKQCWLSRSQLCKLVLVPKRCFTPCMYCNKGSGSELHRLCHL